VLNAGDGVQPNIRRSGFHVKIITKGICVVQ